MLHRICGRLDERPATEVQWVERFLWIKRHCHMTEVLRVWAFGSYARGASDCGDLDLVVEIASEAQPPAPAVYRIFFGSARDVRIYLGTPPKNGSGIEITDPVLLWNGRDYDWRAAIGGIKEDSTATRFWRPVDRLPFRLEQLATDVEGLEQIVEAEKDGLIKWAISPLPDLIDDDELGDSGAHFMRQAQYVGTKTRRMARHILAYMRPRERWFGARAHWDRSDITWGGCRILIGTPYVPLHWLDRLDVFELVIAPHIGRRGPNGIWSIARSDNHPIVRRLMDVEFFSHGWGDDFEPLIIVQELDSDDEIYLVELFRNEAAAVKAAKDNYDDDFPNVQRVSGDNLLALLATADVIQIDDRVFARSHQGKKVYELDRVTPSDELMDIITGLTASP